MGSKTAPAWLTVDTDNLTATVDRLPSKEDIDIPVEEQMIVELYSK
jgi:small subunit ribosomal protein S4